MGWSLAQNNSGVYNRSETNHTLIYEEANNSTERYRPGRGRSSH